MQYALSFLCFLSFGFCFGLSFSSLSIMVRKIRANKKTTSTSTPTFDSERFRSMWAERKIVLDELDLEIGGTLSIGAGYLCWTFLILLRLP